MFCGVEILARGLELGEGPVWHSPTQTLWFVDITRKRILALDTSTRQIKPFETADLVGCVTFTGDGLLLAAVKDTLVTLHPGTGEQSVYRKLEFADYLRFNDGKCDACGRLWVGTMAADQSDSRAGEAGSLYCIEAGAIKARYDGFTIANGMAWSEDNKTFYHVDTPTQKVDAYDTDTDGLLHNRRTAIAFDPADGSPDGMCIDTDGNLWVAMWGGGQVLCADPHSGKILHRLVVQDKNVSCCAFGGEDLQTLFITTAKDDMGHGGNLFAVRTRVAGAKVFEYGG